MASLHEYFVKDGTQNLTTDQRWELKSELGKLERDGFALNRMGIPESGDF